MAAVNRARSDSIVDDWQDVGEDNLSVVSLPGSDDEPATGLTNLTLEDANISGTLAIQPSTQPCVTEYDTDHDIQGTAVPAELQTRSSHGHRDVGDVPLPMDIDTEPLREPSVSECLDFDPDEDQRHEGDHPQQFHGIIDLSVLLQEIESLRAILRDTIDSVNQLTTLHDETSRKARRLCQALAMQVDGLQPVVAGYARVLERSTLDIPLDPSVQSWLTGVRIKALALQVELQDEAQRTLQTGRRESTSGVLHLIWEYLESYEQQMDDFLPIMQVDFNEFHTQHLRIPTAPVVASNRSSTRPLETTAFALASYLPPPRSGRNTYIPPPPSGNSGVLVRTELYTLRDGIVETIAALNRASLYLSDRDSNQATVIAKNFRAILSTLSTLTSNHGSDWIEQGLSSGMTYAEFKELDVEMIRQFGVMLNDNRKHLNNMRYRAEPMFYLPHLRHSATGPPHDDLPDTTVCVLFQLEEVAQVLADMLRVQINQ